MKNETRWTQDLIDDLDDFVADDRYSFGQIAAMMGLSRAAVTSQWRRTVLSYRRREDGSRQSD